MHMNEMATTKIIQITKQATFLLHNKQTWIFIILW